jgi:hypothetical protein
MRDSDINKPWEPNKHLVLDELLNQKIVVEIFCKIGD